MIIIALGRALHRDMQQFISDHIYYKYEVEILHGLQQTLTIRAAFRISYQGGQNNGLVISGGAKYVLKGGHNL